jgi:ABC-type multidrug transport system fused ATPase/permease subunit
VEFAVGAANARSFIDQLPNKGETLIGDRGVRISGGERQRLAIARALLSDPEVLVFDEATSSLDSRSERQVQQAIDRLVGTRTAVVVAHRLSTIKNADRIYVMDGGRIIEAGTHQQLKSQGGLYASLLRLQEATDVIEATGVIEAPLGPAAEDNRPENIIRSGGPAAFE